MDREEARRILAAYRPGDEDQLDPQFLAPLQETARDPELARWFAEERAFDRAIAAHLQSAPVPTGLKTRILASATARSTPAPSHWAGALAAIAAVLFLLAQLLNRWRASAHEAGSLPDYQSEMVSFIQLAPALEMESSDLGTIKSWLGQKDVTRITVPPRLAQLQPVGCRLLSFRGRKVTLICFKRGENNLAHLFVVDRRALPKLKPGAAPVFATDGGWTTASWAEGDRVYMLAVNGGRDAAERLLPRA